MLNDQNHIQNSFRITMKNWNANASTIALNRLMKWWVPAV